MLLVISPAKTLDYDTPPATARFTQPQFLDHAQELIGQLRQMSPQQIGELMHLSDKLSALNVARYGSWHPDFTPVNAKQALLAFKGDVYTGLHAEDFAEADFDFAQQHLRMLSGLYGVLRPLDLMQPYRLEMGTKLANARGNNLYDFWGERISASLSQALMGSPQLSLRLVPREVASLVPISRRYGCIRSSGRSTPYRPESMRRWFCAKSKSASLKSSACRPVYTSPLNASSACLALDGLNGRCQLP